MAQLQGTDYASAFDPNEYIKAFYSSPDGAEDENGYAGFVAKTTRECFGLIGGDRLIEIGCGPCIHIAIEASKKYGKLVLSDYSKANTDQIEKWLDGDEDAMQAWQWLIKQSSEQENVPESAIVERLRYKIQRPLLQCDVMADPIIQIGAPAELYDTAVSSLCLEAACPTLDDFRAAIVRIGTLLNKDGHLLLVTILGETFYRFANATFKCLKLEKQDVEQALEQSGFSIVKSFHLPIQRNEMLSSDFDGVMVLLAKKTLPKNN